MTFLWFISPGHVTHSLSVMKQKIALYFYPCRAFNSLSCHHLAIKKQFKSLDSFLHFLFILHSSIFFSLYSIVFKYVIRVWILVYKELRLLTNTGHVIPWVFHRIKNKTKQDHTPTGTGLHTKYFPWVATCHHPALEYGYPQQNPTISIIDL